MDRDGGGVGDEAKVEAWNWSWGHGMDGRCSGADGGEGSGGGSADDGGTGGRGTDGSGGRPPLLTVKP